MAKVKFSNNNTDSNGIKFSVDSKNKGIVYEIIKLLNGKSNESAKHILYSTIKIIDSNSTVNKV